MNYTNPPLLGLPAEMVERIISELDLQSIKNLRLGCKILSNSCLGPFFKKFFAAQMTDLTKSSLKELNAIASHAQLGPAVKTLTIVANIYDGSELAQMLATKRKKVTNSTGPFVHTTEPACTEDELHQARSDLDWLQVRADESINQSQESIMLSLESAFSAFGTLDLVDLYGLGVQRPGSFVPPNEIRRDEWHAAFVRASHVFRTTTLAIARSKVKIKTLTAFRNTPRCSFPSVDLTTHIPTLKAAGFADVGKHIENIAISISTRIARDYASIVSAREANEGAERLYHDTFGPSYFGLLKSTNPEALAKENFPDVARLLQLMPNLEAFDLHLYNTLEGSTKHYDEIFSLVAQDVHLPALEQCFLRGIPAKAESLLLFLQNHPKINHLDLREVCLTAGTWDPVFARMSTMPALTKLRMSNIRNADGKMVSLAPASGCVWSEIQAKRWSFPCMDGHMVHTMELDADLIKSGLKFYPTPQQRQLGSPWFMSWLNGSRGANGPP